MVLILAAGVFEGSGIKPQKSVEWCTLSAFAKKNLIDCLRNNSILEGREKEKR